LSWRISRKNVTKELLLDKWHNYRLTWPRVLKIKTAKTLMMPRKTCRKPLMIGKIFWGDQSNSKKMKIKLHY
jgi:hypothetical protein